MPPDADTGSPRSAAASRARASPSRSRASRTTCAAGITTRHHERVQLRLSSHRARRRLLRLGVVAGAAVVVGLLIAFVPRGHTFGNHFSSAPAQTVVNRKQVPLTRADRREIDTALDRFVPPAVGRRHPIRARPYAASDLLRGTTRRDWVKGDIPVPPYPVRPGPDPRVRRPLLVPERRRARARAALAEGREGRQRGLLRDDEAPARALARRLDRAARGLPALIRRRHVRVIGA